MCVFPTVVVIGNCLELLLRLEMTAERRHNKKYGSEIRRTQHRTHPSDHRISGRNEKRICKLQCRYPTHNTIPQVRHHRQHGRIDVGFLCSCPATEPIVLLLVLPLRQIREILTIQIHRLSGCGFAQQF